MPANPPVETESLDAVCDDVAEAEGASADEEEEAELAEEEMDDVASGMTDFHPPLALVETMMFVREGVASAICIAIDADNEAARELTRRFGLGNPTPAVILLKPPLGIISKVCIAAPVYVAGADTIAGNLVGPG